MLSRDFAKFFGHIVRKHRKARFLTQEQLAEKADLAPKMISLVERLQRNPSVNVADSIAKGLSVPLWRLVKDTENLRLESPAKKSPPVSPDNPDKSTRSYKKSAPVKKS